MIKQHYVFFATLLLSLGVLTGCKDDYICELQKVEQYKKGSIVEVIALHENARIVSHYIHFGDAKTLCEFDNNPLYTVRFFDGSEMRFSHNELKPFKPFKPFNN